MEGEIIDNLWIRLEMYNKICNLFWISTYSGFYKGRLQNFLLLIYNL